MMTGEANRCTLIRVGCLINSTQAAQNKNLPQTYILHTLQRNNLGGLAPLCVSPFSPAATSKK